MSENQAIILRDPPVCGSLENSVTSVAPRTSLRALTDEGLLFYRNATLQTLVEHANNSAPWRLALTRLARIAREMKRRGMIAAPASDSGKPAGDLTRKEPISDEDLVSLTRLAFRIYRRSIGKACQTERWLRFTTLFSQCRDRGLPLTINQPVAA